MSEVITLILKIAMDPLILFFRVCKPLKRRPYPRYCREGSNERAPCGVF